MLDFREVRARQESLQRFLISKEGLALLQSGPFLRLAPVLFELQTSTSLHRLLPVQFAKPVGDIACEGERAAPPGQFEHANIELSATLGLAKGCRTRETERLPQGLAR